MLTSWILLLFIQSSASSSTISVVGNLSSAEECDRVYETIKDFGLKSWKPEIIRGHICVEVKNAR